MTFEPVQPSPLSVKSCSDRARLLVSATMRQSIETSAESGRQGSIPPAETPQYGLSPASPRDSVLV